MRGLLAAASRHEFWTTGPGEALVILAGGLVIGLGVAFILARRGRRGSARERIGEFIDPPEPVQPLPLAQPTTAAGAERSFERTRWWAELTEVLDIARIDRSPLEIVYLTGAATIAGAVSV